MMIDELYNNIFNNFCNFQLKHTNYFNFFNNNKYSFMNNSTIHNVSN